MANLLITDDHPLFLKGLHRFLIANGHKVVSCAKSGREMLEKLGRADFDLLIVDVSMANGGGLEALANVRGLGNGIPVIFLTANIKGSKAVTAIREGVNGIVLKSSDPSDLLGAIDTVLAGGSYIAPSVMELALRYSVGPASSEQQPARLLTGREHEIATLVSEGLRNKDIARRFGLTEGTIKTHLHSIFRKLGVSSRSELMLRMLGSMAERSR